MIHDALRFWRRDNPSVSAVSLDLLPEYPSLCSRKLISLLLRINLANPLLWIAESRVILVHHNRCYQADYILFYPMPVEHILEHPLDHVSDATL